MLELAPNKSSLGAPSGTSTVLDVASNTSTSKDTEVTMIDVQYGYFFTRTVMKPRARATERYLRLSEVSTRLRYPILKTFNICRFQIEAEVR